MAADLNASDKANYYFSTSALINELKVVEDGIEEEEPLFSEGGRIVVLFGGKVGPMGMA